MTTETRGVSVGNIIKLHTDWSRQSRTKLALLKSASAPGQSKIASFYKVVDEVSTLIDNTPEISTILHAAQERSHAKEFQVLSPLFKKLIMNAEKNALKLPSQRRHDAILQKFSTSLLIYCGPAAYKFIHGNMPKAIPSLRTVQWIIAKEYTPISEGAFRFDELSSHLKSYGAASVIAIGEDATRVISRVEYDNETDRLVVFVLPCDFDGLPICDTFIAVSFEKIEESFRTGSVAKYAFVYMAQPLSQHVPAFCLACLGTDNKFTAEHVLKRWNYIVSKCKERSIQVCSFGADGDSRELKAMQVSAQLFSNSPLSSQSPSEVSTLQMADMVCCKKCILSFLLVYKILFM